MEYIMANCLLVIKVHEKSDLYKRVVRVLSSFNNSEELSYKRIVEIHLYARKIEIYIDGTIESYEDILASDIYPIMYATLYKLTIWNNELFVHSTVVYKDMIGILILGDFHSGKTTLALEFEKNGWHIASYDQSILKKCGGQLIMRKGSCYQSISGSSSFIYQKRAENIEINAVLNIRGLNEAAETDIKKVFDFNNIYRGTWNHFLWPWFTPLTNKQSIIKMDEQYIAALYHFFVIFEKLSFFSVRGSAKGIVDYFESNKNIIA